MLGVVFFGTILHGCKIDVIPTDRYSDKIVWSNPADIDLYVYSLYNEPKNFAFGRIFNLGYNNASDAFTDIEKYTSTSEGNGTVNRLAFDANRYTATSPGINYWGTAYERIRRVNEFLSGLDKYGGAIDTTLANEYRAEARFIRGYTYFWLAKLHGSVVLLNAPTSESRARSSEDSCWNFIANDFAYAASKLPVAWPATYTGRATKGAAYGFLSRTWLYAASIADYDNKQFNNDPLTGVPSAKKQEYYQNAANASAAVIALANQGTYQLEPNYSNIFLNRNSREALFTIFYAKPSVVHDFDLYFAPPRDVTGALAAGVPTAEMVDEYEMRDGTRFSWSNPTQAANPYQNREARFYASILYNGATWKGRVLNLTSSDAVEGFAEATASTDLKRTTTGYYIKKMLDSTNTTIAVSKSDQPWHEMRLAEVYLINAEANVKLGNFSEAANALNKVRNRAGLPNTTAVTTTDFMAAIEHERKVELAFEGHRFWDLRRWRKAHIVLNNMRVHGHKITSVSGVNSYTVVDADGQDRHFTTNLYYLPIPQAEVQRNNKLVQIAGW